MPARPSGAARCRRPTSAARPGRRRCRQSTTASAARAPAAARTRRPSWPRLFTAVGVQRLPYVRSGRPPSWPRLGRPALRWRSARRVAPAEGLCVLALDLGTGFGRVLHRVGRAEGRGPSRRGRPRGRRRGRRRKMPRACTRVEPSSFDVMLSLRQSGRSFGAAPSLMSLKNLEWHALKSVKKADTEFDFYK